MKTALVSGRCDRFPHSVGKICIVYASSPARFFLKMGSAKCARREYHLVFFIFSLSLFCSLPGGATVKISPHFRPLGRRRRVSP